MFAIVESISSIYHYQTNRKSWKNPGYASVYCLSYQLAGHYDHKFDSGVLEVKKDTLFLITKHTPYSVLCREHGKAICVTLSAQIDLPASVYDCTTHPEIKIMFQKLLSYKNLKSKSNYCEAMAIIYKILSFIYQKTEPSYIAHDVRTKIKNAYVYLMENYSDMSLNISEIAEKYNMSPKYFRTVFKKFYNTTPSQMLISIRLQTAVNFLAETDLSISSIAQMSGFSDVYYFSKLFKKRFCVSPKEYRKQYKTSYLL